MGEGGHLERVSRRGKRKIVSPEEFYGENYPNVYHPMPKEQS